MEIRELKIFLSVAQNGSISKAAAQLHYVQSNVTARIKKLETERMELKTIAGELMQKVKKSRPA